MAQYTGFQLMINIMWRAAKEPADMSSIDRQRLR